MTSIFLLAYLLALPAQAQVATPPDTVQVAVGPIPAVVRTGWWFDSMLFLRDGSGCIELQTKPRVQIFFQGTISQNGTVYALPGVGKTVTIDDSASVSQIGSLLAKDGVSVYAQVEFLAWKASKSQLAIPDSTFQALTNPFKP